MNTTTDATQHETIGGEALRLSLLKDSSEKGHLLVANTQNAKSGRLTAFASEEALAGYTWTPINSVTLVESKALAVWLNSTPGRIAMRRVLSRELAWPMWQPNALMNVTIPDIRSAKGNRCKEILLQGFEALKPTKLEKYRDGYTAVRQEIDKIVSEATNLPLEQIFDWGRKLAAELTIKGDEIAEDK